MFIRLITYLLFFSCAFIMVCADFVFSPVLAGKQVETEIQETIKPETPKSRPSFDPEKLPDPFVSYFIRSKRNEALENERKKKEELAREEKLKQEQIAAEKMLEKLKEQKTELQKLELSQLTVTAIVQDGKKDWAMVRDPRGMGFILKKGIAIGTNGGIIKKISYKEKTISIEEPYLDEKFKLKFKLVAPPLKMQDELFE
jgi:hypothetical protein